MLANSLISGAAVLRQSQRYEGVPATHAWQQVLDDRFPDSRLAKIYPSMGARGRIKKTRLPAPLKSQRAPCFRKARLAFNATKKQRFFVKALPNRPAAPFAHGSVSYFK